MNTALSRACRPAKPPLRGRNIDMKTKILGTTEHDIAEAAEIIRRGGLVAFPTETVYGLGADALDPEAVRSIYLAKGRPSDNPTIVHIAEPEDLKRLTPEVTADMETLAAEFWPGPMTMIVRRMPVVPDVTTGGLDTVGVRMPANDAARALIKAAGTPIAAPSANISGKPSPTNARDVLEDMDGRIDAVIDGGTCGVGIESTVIDMTEEMPMILRPGILTAEELGNALGKEVRIDPALLKKPGDQTGLVPKAPGQKYKHYAPNAEMILYKGRAADVAARIERDRAAFEAEGKRVAVISFDEGGEKQAAHDFFTLVRQADRDGADVILTAALREEGIGFSVMNRMLKSAGYNIVEV